MKYVRKTISLPKDILETGKERARQFVWLSAGTWHG
jgi:hypothetical protein